MVERRARRSPGAHTGVGRRRGTARPPPAAPGPDHLRRHRPRPRHPHPLRRTPRHPAPPPSDAGPQPPSARPAAPTATPAARSRPAPRRPAPPPRSNPAPGPRPKPAEPPTDLARVARALDEARQLAERQNRPDLGNHLEQARKRLGEQVLSVAVVGEFKRGKSTLVNALLQTDVCPTDADIVTAVPTVVRYGPEPSAAALLEPAERPAAVDNPPPRTPRPAPSRSPSTSTGSPTSSPRPPTRAGGGACARSRSASPTACSRPGWASSTPPASAAWSRRTGSSPSARCAPPSA